MDGIGRPGCAHYIANPRAGDSDLRSTTENRTISHIFCWIGDRRAKSTRREGSIGTDEHIGLYTWTNAAAHGSDRSLRGGQLADAGSGRGGSDNGYGISDLGGCYH